jgi:hypothetical protein
MKKLILLSFLGLSACCTNEVAPQAYMPAPPEILMRAPKDLNTIRQTEPTQEESNDQ